MTRDLGEWKPLRPEQVLDRMAGVGVPWWIAGGWALDLHLGRQTRPHADLDVGLLRADQQAVFAALADWELFVAADGRLRPLSCGESLRPEEHDVWCRPGPARPWALELMLDEHRGNTWVYRRDPRVERPLEQNLLYDPAGIPYLAPEVQLLFKSKGRREKDARDLEAVLPTLEGTRREWLATQLRLLDPAHPWLVRLRDAAT